jgi:hypothetical protein
MIPAANAATTAYFVNEYRMVLPLGINSVPVVVMTELFRQPQLVTLYTWPPRI